jgi:hypothetical protein
MKKLANRGPDFSRWSMIVPVICCRVCTPAQSERGTPKIGVVRHSSVENYVIASEIA